MQNVTECHRLSAAPSGSTGQHGRGPVLHISASLASCGGSLVCTENTSPESALRTPFDIEKKTVFLEVTEYAHTHFFN